MPSETTIREVTPGVWTFSKPFARGPFAFGGRSTAIRLQNGGVWVLASTPLDTETKAKLTELGAVKYIVSPDAEHHFFLAEFKKAYPDAKLIAPVDVLTKHKELEFDGAWGRDEEGTKYGFEDEIEHQYFSGFKNKDVAFLHKPSKTLIEADLIMNTSKMTEQYAKTKTSPKVLGLNLGFGPYSWFHPHFCWALGDDKAAMARDAKLVQGWDFTRIIPCHGDVIETGGKEAWNAAYKKYFK